MKIAATIVLVTIIVGILLAPGIPVLSPQQAAAALPPPSHPLFDGDAVHEFHLTFHQAGWWDSLRVNFEGLDDPLYLAAEFDWAGTHLDSIGVRFKGNSSYNSNNTEKKSFKLDIDEYIQGQDISGLDKLNLNCGFKDPSFVREAACYEVCGEAGLVQERTNFVALYINGTYWGLYTLIEQYDQQFIESRFGPSEEGNLWKGDPRGTLEYEGVNQAAYYDNYELKTNEELNDWSGLIERVDKLNNTPIASLPDSIHPVIDVTSALAMLAIDNLTVNLDSYIGRCANYYFYHRDVDDRFVFAKWDLNEAWGVFTQGLPLNALKYLDPYWLNPQPGQNRPLAEQLWSVDAYNDLYIGHMQKLMAGTAHPDTLIPRMEELRDLIRPYVYLEAPPRRIFTSSQFEIAMSTDISGGGPGGIIPGVEPFVRDRDSWLRGQIGSWTPIDGLVLNELMAVNNGTIGDEYGEFEDWIEIANVGPASINLDGLALSDNPGNAASYFYFPDVDLAPGEYLVVWADAEPLQGSLHAPFKLDGDGEDLYLMDGAVIVEQRTFPALGADQSFGRWPDGSGDWQLLSQATPGAENQNPVLPEEVVLYLNEFMAINDSGLQDETGAYEDWLEIYNPGPAGVEMGGLYLTDDLTLTTAWAFPDTVLEAGAFMVVFCDNDPGDGPLHTTFKLSGSGEELGLFGRLAAGNLEIDSYAFGVQTADISEGREADGGPDWVFFIQPTPGATNSGGTAAPGPEEESGVAPLRLALLPCMPNPFNPQTTLRFELPGAGQVRLGMYDTTGRRVVRLLDRVLEAGSHEASWNGRDDRGRLLPSGIYFSRLTFGSRTLTGRVTLLR